MKKYALVVILFLMVAASSRAEPIKELKCGLNHITYFAMNPVSGLPNTTWWSYSKESTNFTIPLDLSNPLKQNKITKTVLLALGDETPATIPVIISALVIGKGILVKIAATDLNGKYLGTGSIQYINGMNLPTNDFTSEQTSISFTVRHPTDTSQDLVIFCDSSKRGEP